MLLKVQNKVVAKENFSPKLLRPRRVKKTLLESLFPPFKIFKSGMNHELAKDLSLALYGIYPNGAGADKDHSKDYAAFVLNTHFYFIPDDLLKEAIASVSSEYAPQDGEMGIVTMMKRELLVQFGKNPDSNWKTILRLGVESLSNGRKDHPRLLEALENLKVADKEKLLK